MNPRVTEVKPETDFKLKLTFSNGEKRVFNMNPYLNAGRFTELKNHAMFSSVICTMGTIQWQNGLDLCPDTLYEDSEPYKIESKKKVVGSKTNIGNKTNEKRETINAKQRKW